jgi:hypothetical protein
MAAVKKGDVKRHRTFGPATRGIVMSTERPVPASESVRSHSEQNNDKPTLTDKDIGGPGIAQPN